MPAPCPITLGLLGTDAKHQHFSHTESSGSKAGKVKNTARVKNGVLLIELYKKKHADHILKLNIRGYYPVNTERHLSLKFVRGVVSTLSSECLTRRFSLLLLNSPFQTFANS
jgi:hypothetical protein